MIVFLACFDSQPCSAALQKKLFFLNQYFCLVFEDKKEIIHLILRLVFR